jgi:hypothetical protein
LVAAEEVDFIRQHLLQIVEVGLRVRMAGGSAAGGADMLPGSSGLSSGSSGLSSNSIPGSQDEVSSKEAKEAANELLVRYSLY